MKKFALFLLVSCLVVALGACGETVGKTVLPTQPSAQTTPSQTPAGDADADAPAADSGNTAEPSTPQTTQPPKEEPPKVTYDTIDVDLSAMSGTVAYSQVYDMLYNPSRYTDKVVKMKGPFSAFYSNQTRLYYPAVIIRDATACCSQGIEFVLSGNPAYPSGYPKANSEITVVGKFEIYYEGSNKYCHLVNAVLV